MAFTRASNNGKKVGPEWCEAYRVGGAKRAELFVKFVENNGNIDAVNMQLKRERLSAVSTTVRKEWLTRRELIEKFKDETVVDQVVAAKRATGEWRRTLSLSGRCL